MPRKVKQKKQDMQLCIVSRDTWNRARRHTSHVTISPAASALGEKASWKRVVIKQQCLSITEPRHCSGRGTFFSQPVAHCHLLMNLHRKSDKCSCFRCQNDVTVGIEGNSLSLRIGSSNHTCGCFNVIYILGKLIFLKVYLF